MASMVEKRSHNLFCHWIKAKDEACIVNKCARKSVFAPLKSCGVSHFLVRLCSNGNAQRVKFVSQNVEIDLIDCCPSLSNWKYICMATSERTTLQLFFCFVVAFLFSSLLNFVSRHFCLIHLRSFVFVSIIHAAAMDTRCMKQRKNGEPQNWVTYLIMRVTLRMTCTTNSIVSHTTRKA